MGDFLTDSWDDIERFFGLNGKTTATVPGATAANAATLANAGLITSVFGGITSAIGGYYAAKTQQYQEKAQASSLEFQAGIDAINARQSEMSAQSILESGKTQTQQYTMREGQEEAGKQVATAARGVDLSSGSAVEQRASDDLVKQIDVQTIDANATRAAWAERTQATNYSNSALLARTGAANLNASASTISPWMGVSTSLLNTASTLGSQWDWRRRVTMSALNGAAA